MIGKIKRVKLREVWKHEALDFTVWLESNIDVLGEALDLNLLSAEREQNAGTFSVDLVAEDESGNPVIIENQLERSNHDHLGKLITYLTALDAKTAIWIVADPRPEHVRAISWLNESSSGAFFLVKVEAIQIGDSPPAPLLTMITGPSEEAREAGAKKKELAEKEITRKAFWTGLLDRAKQKTSLHSSISPGHHHWVGTASGLPAGLALNYVVRRHDGRVELYIDAGKDSGERNTEILSELLASREDIEAAFGEPLDWESLETKRACRVSKTLSLGGLDDEEVWPAVHDAMVDAMIRLEKALKPSVSRL